jgi:hypothetical protein
MNVRRLAAPAALVVFLAKTSSADWVQFALPSLSASFSPVAIGHLSDGRYVYAEGGQFYQQDAWGGAAYSSYSGEPVGVDPSFVAIRSDDTAVAGGGGFGPSALYSFDPSNLAAPGFAASPFTLPNYQGVFRNDHGLYINGVNSGFTNGVSYVTMDGSTNKLIIADISLYSAGFALDGAGNLFVGDNDDGRVYRFTAAQLESAIVGAPLTVADGAFVHDFGTGGDIGSMAIDGLGRVWVAGYLNNGIRVYNPDLDQEFGYIPNLTNANYFVSSFTRGGEHYIAYVNEENPFSSGTDVHYGYDLAASLAIPEPGTLALLGCGAAAILRRRQRA